MAGMSASDVVAPSTELAQARLTEAITVKQQMVDGPFAAQAVEVAQLMIGCLRCWWKGHLLRQRWVCPGRRAPSRRAYGPIHFRSSWPGCDQLARRHRRNDSNRQRLLL